MESYTPFGPKTETPPVPKAAEDSSVESKVAEAASLNVASSEPVVDEQQARLDYVKSIVPPRPPKKRWPRVVGIVLVILVLAAAGAWAALGHKSKASPKKSSSSAALVAPSPTSSSTGLANYVANGQDLNLNFNYPSSWSVTPATGTDTIDQAITLNSPLTTITSASGSKVTGKVTLSIRPGTAQLTELGSSTTAALASVQFAYSKPTASQHQYPYLTFIHVAASTNPSGSFSEVLVTGITQFNAGDSLTAASVSVDPIISTSFYNCSTSACTGSGATPLSITSDTWQNANLFKQTLAVFESLQLN